MKKFILCFVCILVAFAGYCKDQYGYQVDPLVAGCSSTLIIPLKDACPELNGKLTAYRIDSDVTTTYSDPIEDQSFTDGPWENCDKDAVAVTKHPSWQFTFHRGYSYSTTITLSAIDYAAISGGYSYQSSDTNAPSSDSSYTLNPGYIGSTEFHAKHRIQTNTVKSGA